MRWLVAATVLWATAAPARADAGYPLDPLPREAAGAVACPAVPLLTYRGHSLALHRPAVVHVALVPALRRLEELVRATAIEVYGRAPARLVHAGAYSCRKLRPGRRWLSEHSLGNAIDIRGVDFAAANDRRVPGELRGAFEVRVKAHWRGGRGVAGMHSRFLRLLAERVIADEQFRVILGPARRDHADHFHFDMAPYRHVEVF
jgi:hypothetical protein